MTAPPSLADLRLHPRHEEDLRWYWCEASGALGLRAVSPTQGSGNLHNGAPMANMGPSEAQVNAVARVRRIERRLLALPVAFVQTLAAAYGPGLTPALETAWGWLSVPSLPTALVLLMAKRRGLSERKMAKWQGAKGDPKAKPPKPAIPANDEAIGDLRLRAQVALAQAGKAYAEAKPDTQPAGLRARPVEGP